MLDNLQIFTVTHRTVNLRQIGEFLPVLRSGEELHDRLVRLRTDTGQSELLYLATCNRVLYFVSGPTRTASDFFQQINPALSPSALAAAQHFQGRAAIDHLFSVAASIDSLVIGEREILRQLREAYDQCQKWDLTGDQIRLAIRFAVEAAKEVYAQTRIGEKPVSVVSLAVQQLLNHRLSRQARILLIGAGQTNTLVAKFLHKHGFEHVTVFNRTLAKAQELAQRFGWNSMELSALTAFTQGFDCLIVCTGATQTIITPDLYRHLLQGDPSSKLLIDLSVPNNADKSLPETFSLDFFDVEDLRHLAKENYAFREREVEHARRLLHVQVQSFDQHFLQRKIERAMHNVPQAIKAVKAHVMEEVFQKEISLLDEDTRHLFERALSYMEKKCISIPMKAAKESVLPPG